MLVALSLADATEPDSTEEEDASELAGTTGMELLREAVAVAMAASVLALADPDE